MSAFAKYPIRTCRSLHHCSVCHQAIVAGDDYHDGGYGRRAHVACAAYVAPERAAQSPAERIAEVVAERNAALGQIKRIAIAAQAVIAEHYEHVTRETTGAEVFMRMDPAVATLIATLKEKP